MCVCVCVVCVGWRGGAGEEELVVVLRGADNNFFAMLYDTDFLESPINHDDWMSMLVNSDADHNHVTEVCSEVFLIY